jgi:glyoxylase-like metal-dependent hydrolase (beta-lactamase superfamily II)
MSVYEVVAVRYATRRAWKSGLYHRFESYGEPDTEASLDYYFWLVRDGPKAILIDTGFDPDVGERRGRTLLCEPREAMRRAGLSIENVAQVIITHFHYDHVGNIDAFPNAELLVPQRELDFWTSPPAGRAQFAEHVEPAEIARLEAACGSGRGRALSGEETIAPGLTAITVGGHSPGQLVLLVETARGLVVLASDAVHFYEELELDRPFAIIADLADMYRGYDLLRELQRDRQAIVVPGHDPGVMARFPSLGGAEEGIGVRVA